MSDWRSETVEYYAWLLMAMVAAGLSFISIGRFVADPQNSDYTDILTLMVAAALDIFTSINAFSLDFIGSSGNVIPYYGMQWVAYPFFAMFILTAGFVMIAVIIIFKNLKINKLYPNLWTR